MKVEEKIIFLSLKHGEKGKSFKVSFGLDLIHNDGTSVAGFIHMGKLFALGNRVDLYGLQI
jgi:hypothetical protein